MQANLPKYPALKKLAKKLKLSEETLKGIIITNHELKYLTPKSQLVEVELDIDLKENKKTIATVDKIAAKLKVSREAVIVAALYEYAKNYKEGV